MPSAPYSALGLAHAAAAVLALAAGTWIFLDPKGTARHRRVGWVYVASMTWVDASSFAIRHLTGRLNLFHALAAFSLVMVIGGVAQVVLRRHIRRWLWRRASACWSLRSDGLHMHWRTHFHIGPWIRGSH